MRFAPRLVDSLNWLALLPLLTFGGRPDLYEIPLAGTGPSSRLKGMAVLKPARSPFGVAVSREGYFVFRIEIDVPMLPSPTSYGAGHTTFVAWLATADLDRIVRLGPVTAGATTTGRVTMNKFLVVITAEPDAKGDKWTGPIVMKGNSPSSFLSNFSGHTMFNGGVPQ